MSKFKPFRALRPIPEKAKQVASRPYDVLDSKEAKEEAAGNEYFLRVIKPEIELSEDCNPYSPEVYEKRDAKPSQNAVRWYSGKR